MKKRTFYAGLKLRLIFLVFSVISAFIGILLIAFENPARSWLFLFFLTAINFSFFVIYTKKPLFVISQEEIEEVDACRKIQVKQVERVRPVGYGNLEIFLKGTTIPVFLNTWKLSKQDREQLRAMVDDFIMPA